MWLINGRPFILNFNIYYEDIQRDWTRHLNGFVNFRTGEFRSEISSLNTNKMTFNWNWSRKSWIDAKNPIFIDFGGSELFRVIEGMGRFKGRGINIKKSSFIKKYNGDLKKISLVQPHK